jgi:magnesium chelatase family protein
VGAVEAAARGGRDGVVLPADALGEARLVRGPVLYGVRTVFEALDVLAGKGRPDEGRRGPPPPRARGPEDADLREVRGQRQARRALEVAAAGGHNLLFEGPPGSGKTMLARRLPTILPSLEDAAALESARIRSAVRHLDVHDLHTPPFRAPHHSATAAGLVGGGSPVRPGELSLAHRGVLFLDELPEFDRRALEVLREPLEEGWVHLVRAGQAVRFPASFLCVGAYNPCPCGWAGLAEGRCRCPPGSVQRYRARLSGPLLDRFDLRVVLRPLTPEQLFDEGEGETSEAVRERVLAARARQAERQGRGRLNAGLREEELRAHAAYGAPERALLRRLVGQAALSARGLRRLERVARTVADLAGAPKVGALHLQEALGWRLLTDAAETAERGGGAASG